MPASASRSRVSSVSVRPGLSQPRGGLPGELADRLDRVADGGALVVDAMHRPLHEAVAHEVPAGLEGGLAGLRVERAAAAVHRESRLELARAQHVEETPEAHPHAVFVPRPVGHVGQQRIAHRRRQHGAWHGAQRTPVLDIDDGPHRHAGAAGKSQLRPLVDGQVGRAVADAMARLLCHRGLRRDWLGRYSPLCGGSPSRRGRHGYCFTAYDFWWPAFVMAGGKDGSWPTCES